MRQWPGSALIHVMACRLFSAKPLPESMMAYCRLDSWEQISVKFKSEFYYFHSRKCIWNCRLPKWRPFCPGGDELIIHRPSPKWDELIIPDYHFGFNTKQIKTTLRSEPILPFYRGPLYCDSDFMGVYSYRLNWQVHKHLLFGRVIKFA